MNNNLEAHSSTEEISENGIQFRPSRLNNGDESGVCSPPLWSKIPAASKLSQNNIRNSPTSLRVQAIARGQKELMDMVKRMPESSYELSLKDLVDHQKPGFQEKTSFIMKKKIARTGSNMSESNNNTGLFLKMVFPMPFGASQKPKGQAKTKENNLNHKSSKSVDKKQWWQRRYSDDSESSSIGSSGSSGSSGSTITNRKKGGLLSGCCSPFDSKRNNTVE